MKSALHDRGVLQVVLARSRLLEYADRPGAGAMGGADDTRARWLIRITGFVRRSRLGLDALDGRGDTSNAERTGSIKKKSGLC